MGVNLKLASFSFLILGFLLLAGCNSSSDQPPRDTPNGNTAIARQANYEAACVAKGNTAAACEQTNPVDDYTEEFRQSMLAQGALITQCLDGSVEACRLIRNRDVGHCSSFATEVVEPSDATYRDETREICALELEIIGRAERP